MSSEHLYISNNDIDSVAQSLALNFEYKYNLKFGEEFVVVVS